MAYTAETMNMPAWLTPVESTQDISNGPPDPCPYAPATARQVLEIQFQNLFPRVLEDMAEGVPFDQTLEQDGRWFKPGQFLSWVRKDHDRWSKYKTAQELLAEKLARDVLEIADAKDNPLEDVARSNARINSRKWLAGVYNRQRFGDIKQVEVTASISVRTALEMADNRLDLFNKEDDVIDMDDTPALHAPTPSTSPPDAEADL